MCGVVGALVFDGSDFRVGDGYLARMRDVLAHRGPDGSGAWIAEDGRVGLGHRRLAIINPSPQASQPMPNEDGTLWLSFNGAIYNHAELRAELERTGRHRWRTDHSDTEVILHAFEEWGIECLHRFRGMFAFALWDARARELWLVRDRIGVKPLYYSVHHGRITFASEIKALLADPAQPRAVDEESLYHYLSFLATPAPRTLFAGIRKLAGGTWLRVRESGEMREQRWWELWDHVTPQPSVSDADVAARVLDEVRTAVRLRQESDVPVGAFLSGGIDSSTIVALCAERGGRVPTYAIGYEGELASQPSELRHARRMAERVGAVHRDRSLSVDDLLRYLPEMAWSQDEPIADPVCVPVHYVAQLARDDGVVVCQVGEGADELFWGYPTWKRMLRVQRLDDLPVPRPAKRAAMHAMGLAGRGGSFGHELLRRAGAGQPVFWGGAEGIADAHKRRLLAPSVRRSLAGLTSWEAIRPIHERFREGAWEPSHLAWMSYLDLNLRLPELLLMRVDKMAMSVGVEGRVPFLDHEVVQLAMGIPEAVKTRGGTLKGVLKAAVRGLIPDEVIDRPKQGFGVPVAEWMRAGGPLGARMRAEIDDFCASAGLLDPAQVRRTLDAGDVGASWQLLNLALWWKAYLA